MVGTAFHRVSPVAGVASTEGAGQAESHTQLPDYLLFVSGDISLSQEWAIRLVRYGLSLELAPSIAEAKTLAVRQLPALLFIDRRLQGWRTLRHSFPFQTVPMMTLVPRESGLTDEDCITDLEDGMDSTHLCDESPRLLVAKVRALLRRSAWTRTVPTVIRAGNVELDLERREVRVDGHAHHLPPVQFQLLKHLMESPGTVLRRQALCDLVWGTGYAMEAHTLDVHLFWLRRLLERDQGRRHTIVTIRGVGFKFVVEAASGATSGLALYDEHNRRQTRQAPCIAIRAGLSHDRLKAHPDSSSHHWSKRSGRSSL